MMLMAELVKESADIIHEMTPTQDQMNEIGIEIFTPNYKAPKANEHDWEVYGCIIKGTSDTTYYP